MQRKILPTITTTYGSNWRQKIKEIKKMKLKEIAIFPTCLMKEGRRQLYQMLKRSGVESIPYVHLRSDMGIEEMDYLIKNYKTKVFNTHTEREYPFRYDYSKYRQILYIENVYYPLDKEEVKKFAGICLDFSHLENDRLRHKKTFEHNIRIIEKFPIGCSHISAIKKETWIDQGDGYDKNKARYDWHQFSNFSELDYLKKYPKRYFPKIIAIELENSIEEQLRVKDYLTAILTI